MDRLRPPPSCRIGRSFCGCMTHAEDENLRAGLAWATRCTGSMCRLTRLIQRMTRLMRLTARLIRLTARSTVTVPGLAFGPEPPLDCEILLRGTVRVGHGGWITMNTSSSDRRLGDGITSAVLHDALTGCLTPWDGQNDGRILRNREVMFGSTAVTAHGQGTCLLGRCARCGRYEQIGGYSLGKK